MPDVWWKLLKCRACRQRLGRATVESENCCTATVMRLPLSVHRPRLTARQAKIVLRSIEVCCSIGAVATAVQGGSCRCVPSSVHCYGQGYVLLVNGEIACSGTCLFRQNWYCFPTNTAVKSQALQYRKMRSAALQQLRTCSSATQGARMPCCTSRRPVL